MWEILQWLDAAASKLGNLGVVQVLEVVEVVDVASFSRGRNIEWQGVLSSNVERICAQLRSAGFNLDWMS